jgi:hypothetical protein
VTDADELGLTAVLIGGPCAGEVRRVPAHTDLPPGWYRGHTDVPRFGTYRISEDADLLRRVVAYVWTGMTDHGNPQEGNTHDSDGA